MLLGADADAVGQALAVKLLGAAFCARQRCCSGGTLVAPARVNPNVPAPAEQARQDSPLVLLISRRAQGAALVLKLHTVGRRVHAGAALMDEDIAAGCRQA